MPLAGSEPSVTPSQPRMTTRNLEFRIAVQSANCSSSKPQRQTAISIFGMDLKKLPHSNSFFPLLTLPSELVDRICSEVAGIPNLQSLGLTCKFLAAIIFPNHILYHTIQAPLNYEYFWIYLIQNPLMCRYVRRLEIRDTKIRIPPLKQDVALVTSFPYRRSVAMEDNFWCYELFTRAILQMTNLRAFFWERVQSPVLFTRGELWKDFILKNKQGKLDRDFSMDRVLAKSPRPTHVSFFDTPAAILLWSLVSLTVVTRLDHWNSGESLVGLLRQCQALEYLSLFIGDHVLIKGFVTFCRLPKLRVLSVNLYRDRSPTPSPTAISEFFNYHTSLIRLKWFVSLRLGSRLDVEVSPNSLPRLECLEADPHFTTLLLSTSCDPPRPLGKIIRFPLNTQVLANPTLGLQGIDTSCLRTVSFKRIASFADISRFVSYFPNVECLDVSHSDIPTGIWDALLREYHIPPQTLTRWLDSLEQLTKLRYLRGIQFFIELDRPEIIKRRLELIMRVFPRLEFFSDPSSAMDAIQIVRNGELISWKPSELRQWDLYFGLEGDSTI